MHIFNITAYTIDVDLEVNLVRCWHLASRPSDGVTHVQNKHFDFVCSLKNTE